MRTRTLGKTGIEIPELCLGTWGLSGDAYGSVEEAEQDQVIERALALGITAFETSDAYAKGAMETRLGSRLEQHPGALVITKLGTDRSETPPRKRFDPEYIERAIEASKSRLKRHPDVVLLHNPSAIALKRGPARELLDKLVKGGTLRAWGASVGDPEVGKLALELELAVIEVAYNVFHLRDLAPLITGIKEKRVGVLAHSVLAHGLLCGQWPTTKQFSFGDHRRERWTSDELRKRLNQLSAVRPSVYGACTSLRAVALRFVLSEETISSVVLGPRSAIQLDQLVRDAGKEPPYLASEVKLSLERRLSNVGIRP
jgi:aryl-alcohol dehydrogenase-like predicted oxidoreductase